MTDIKNLYDEFSKIPFPDNLSGEEIQGIDLVLLDSDTAGSIDKFISYRGQLNIDDFKLLRQCFAELQRVTRELQGQQRLYFSTLLNIAHRTIDYLTNTNRLIDDKGKEKLLDNWKADYIRIRDILNDWDILGVADMIDDEYDSLNFLAYSALINNGGLDNIKFAIKKYLNESLDIDIPEADLTDLAVKIKKIKD